MTSKKGIHTPGKIAGGLSYQVTPGARPAIMSTGRMDRPALEATQIGLMMPAEIRTRIELLLEGGGIGGAVNGLLLYALDRLEEEKGILKISLGG